MMLVLVIIILSGGCFDSDDCGDGDHCGVRIPWSTVSCHHQPSSPSNPSIYHSSFFPAFFYFLFLPALVLRHSSTRQRLLKSSRECKMWDRILGIPLDTSGYPQFCNGLKVEQQSSLGYPQRCRAHIGEGPAHWSGGLHALDTKEIKLACYACEGLQLMIL